MIPCYKLFLKDLKEIMLTRPMNYSLSAVTYGNEASECSPDIDVELISIKHHHHFPVGSTVVEAVNRGVQTNIRTLNPQLFNGQVVSDKIIKRKRT